MEYRPHNWPEHHRWNKENGDYTHRLNYDLTENSTVFDVGGYKGDWANKIKEKYNCKIYIFEPVKSFYDEIINKFCLDNRIKVFNFGLGAETESIDITINGDSSNHISKTNSVTETVNIKSIIDFISESEIKSIDLMKLNIEGAEFDLLDCIIKNNKQQIIKDLQVQFHPFIPDCVERRDRIREILTKTHKLTYDFTFIWENWRLK